jgi:hypothetical protein
VCTRQFSRWTSRDKLAREFRFAASSEGHVRRRNFRAEITCRWHVDAATAVARSADPSRERAAEAGRFGEVTRSLPGFPTGASASGIHLSRDSSRGRATASSSARGELPTRGKDRQDLSGSRRAAAETDRSPPEFSPTLRPLENVKRKRESAFAL